MKKYSLKAIAALFLVVIMCLSFIPAAFAAHEHELTKVDGQAATCEEDGWKDCWYCSTCEKYYADAEGTTEIGDAAALTTWKTGDGKIAALNHDFSGKVVASSDASGHYFKCSREGCTAVSPVEAHDFTTNPYKCSVCAYQVQFDVETKGTGIKSKTTKTNGGEACEVTLEADTGYKNPVFKSVTVDGLELIFRDAGPENVPPAQYDYDKNSDSKITVHADKVTGKIVVTGEAIPNKYKISYNLDGGKWVDNDSPKKEEHTYGTSTTIEDTDPTKAGYTFKGWKINNGAATESPVTLAAEGYTADITLTAEWTPKTAPITVVNGKTKGDVTTIKTGEQLEITADDISGKVFKRWKLTAPTGDAASHVKIADKTNKSTKVSVDATITDAGTAVTITAEYNATVTYSYLKSDGTPDTEAGGDYAKGAEITLPYCTIAPDGKAFKCWELGGTTYEAGEKYTMGEDGVTFVAQYVDKTFEVTPAYLEFAAYEGDTKAPAYKTVSIKNTGDSPVTVTLPASTEKYIVRDEATQPITFNTVTIPAGETYKFKVRPADPADKYKEDDSFYDILTIANDAGQKEKVGILFEVTKPLKVSISPETLERNCGESASFTAKASGGAEGYDYQWQVKVPGKDSYTDLYDGQKLCTANTKECACVVSGTDSRTLTLNYAVCKVDGYKFRCVVTDAEDNTVTSGGASLRVKIRGQKEYDKYNYQCTHCGEISPKIKTGDESMPILWASLAGVSLVALAVGAVYYFRKKKKT